MNAGQAGPLTVTNDPVVRYTAGGVVLAAFVACLAIAVHGYWESSSYVLPPFVASILSAGLGGALAILGVHVGGLVTGQGVSQGAAVLRANGSPPPEPHA